MSDLKYCQGPDCHTYQTQDRLKGVKGSKTYQTRRKSYLLFGEFCSQQCTHDWIGQHIKGAIDHYGRTTEAKHLTEENAWVKDWNYPNGDFMGSENRQYFFFNTITKEHRPITEEQYRDNNYTLNTI